MSTREQKVARYVQGVTGLLYTTCLAATRSARLRVEDGPDLVRHWEALAVEDAKARAKAGRICGGVGDLPDCYPGCRHDVREDSKSKRRKP